MPSKKPKERQKYSKQQLESAIKEKRKHPDRTYAELSRFFNVPSSTISDGVKNKVLSHIPGPSTTFTNYEERVILRWILDLRRVGVVIGKRNVIAKAKKLLMAKTRSIEKVKAFSGNKWYQLFKARHPSVRNSRVQKIDPKRLDLKKEEVEKFFKTLKEILEEKNIPWNRIFNGDETPLPFSNIMKESINLSGEKSVQSASETHKQLSLLLTICADGSILKGLYIFKGNLLFDL